MVDFSLRLAQELYEGDIFKFTQEYLLGAYLCSEIDGFFAAGKITEAEVYIGAYDKACHAYPNKLTPRTATMFRRGGCAYVFFVYGMYNQFNVVCGPEGTANAVLIRALEPVVGTDIMKERRKTKEMGNLTTGPGKLCQALAITRQQHDGINLGGNTIWISPRDTRFQVAAAPRIGIDYAEEYKDKPWRFYIADSPFVSHIKK